MANEYYQMGWTLGEQYEEEYYYTREENKYFIKKNATPKGVVFWLMNITKWAGH